MPNDTDATPTGNGHSEDRTAGGTPTPSKWNPWWRSHPAYNDVMDSFDGCNNVGHLAFLVIVGLHRRGWSIVRKDDDA